MFRSLRRSRHSIKLQRFSRFGIECLERRDMLSGTPPTVVNVEIGSTSWSPVFVDYIQTAGLGTNGYSIPKGSTAQSATLNWTDLDRIIIKFSEDVQVDSADLSLSGVNTTAYEFSNFRYDPQTHMATWTLSTPLDRDRLRLDLDADGLDPVHDLDGNILDGEWTNNISTASGNGIAGGDFEFNFNVLPTDVNNTGNITNYDYIYIRQRDGKATTDVGYLATYDIDGNGIINSLDWEEALDRAMQTLPSGSPAGSYNDSPTTGGFGLVPLSDAARDAAISLLAGFEDAEDGSSGLTYSIQSNSNASLFDIASIDPSTQQLVLSAASGGVGRATIMVRATDTGGLFVDTPVTVDVNRENQPPFISSFFVLNAGPRTWIVSGDVSDPDDDVSNFIVRFFGVFVTRSAVDEIGHFEFAIILEEDESGWEYAVTNDPHGLESNVTFSEVGMT